ncbi:hypothetical protein F4703DRAFT_1799956 [Phycomyces blakesleeanus]
MYHMFHIFSHSLCFLSKVTKLLMELIKQTHQDKRCLCASANQTSLRVRLIVALSLEHRSKRSNQSELNKNLLWVVSKWADKKLRQLSGDVYDVYWGITLFCDYKKRATESGIQCEFWWY